MPQAIDRSLATPITNPLFPAINGRGSAISTVRAMAPTLVTDSRLSVSSPASPIHTAEHQCGVSSAETEAVRHHCVNGHVILAFTRDRHVGNRRIDGLDIGGFANE